ncbi:hypothetical protein UA08_05228 [Talaromyces atroroseus]|uniref:Nephrocystin 3-like N-terminal domain-containing protein n=1 Tax=Talaromyces atroroseus TaxID=1441469 RepID=A0A225AX72_TALAT|nr:hypothetical protein UA08_05228 [Talaromyces atroroseus]OKL59576.1 hypothetical protein UA08_05228 [Talaromyces atroroseus]
MSAQSNPDGYEMIEHQDASLSCAALATIQAWLQPTDYDAASSEYHRHLSSQAPGTGLWMLHTYEFRQWHDTSGRGSLWIKGVPGAGKSVLSAAVIERFKKVERVPVLFFFFREIISVNRKPRSLMCDWLAQLLPHSVRLQATLQPLLECELDDMSDDQLWQYLLLGLSSIDKVYCVVDALDEMQLSAEDGFLSRLNDLLTFRPNAVKVLMTSRPNQYLQTSLRDTSIIHINLQQALVDEDIEAYVSYRLSAVLDDPKLLQSLLLTVSKRSSGLFLYARLLLDQIIPSLSSLGEIGVSNLSDILPVGLAEMYDNVLAEQAKELCIDSRDQVTILELATHSFRPMRLNEIACFLGYLHPGLQNPKNITRVACGPLLEILEDETVQVIHHSFTEFLVGSEKEHVSNKEMQRKFPVFDSHNIQKRLTTTLITYLQSGVLLRQDKSDESIGDIYDYASARLKHPLLQYAVTNWAYHASQYDVQDDGFFHAIGKFLDQTSPHFRQWALLEWSPVLKASPSALHVAAFAGLTEYAKFLLQSGNGVDTVDAVGRTPLWWGARQNHTSIVVLLLQMGANPDADDCYGNKPLHEAAKKDNAKSSKYYSRLVMPSGSKLTKGDTAVDYACAQGHPDTLVQILCDSCRNGKHEAVRAVLENSEVSPDSRLYDATALYLATLARSVQCVEALLGNGASVHLESRYLRPSRRLGAPPPREVSKQPLNALANAWVDNDDVACPVIMNLLLEAGADLEYVDGNGETVLFDLFSRRRKPSLAAVRSLLERGSNIAATDKSGRTILHLCVEYYRDIGLLEVIFQYGANIDARDHGGKTLWHSLFKSSVPIEGPDTLDAVVEYLLEKGAGKVCLIQDTDGKTALEKAASCLSCGFQAFRRVLQASPDRAVRERCLWSLISSHRSSPELFNELVSAGVSLKKCASALLASVQNQNMFRTLLHCGARLDAVDKHGRGVLHYYIMTNLNPSASKLQEYVKMGLDPCIVDSNGNTLLHAAASYYMGTTSHVKLIEQILNYGIDINAKNHLGRTALHNYFNSDRPMLNNGGRNALHFLDLLSSKTSKLDVDAQDNDGVTALHISASCSELDVDKLLSAGANSSVVAKNGDNILHMACESGKSNIVTLLLERIGDSLKDQVNKLKRTPLHIACRHGVVESVYCLLRSGLNIHAKDYKGRTPLHACAEFAIEQRLNFVLEYSDNDKIKRAKARIGAVPGSFSKNLNPSHSHNWRPTPPKPLHDTRLIGNTVSMLIDAGAYVTARDSDGKTPLDLAILYECQQMVDSLRHTVTDVPKYWDTNQKYDVFSTVVALNQMPRVSALESADISLQDILADPAHYINILSMPDLEFLLKAGADFTAERSHFTKISFLHSSVRSGRLDFIEKLGSAMKTFDDADFIKRVLEENGNRKINYPPYFEPMLHVACNQELSNLAVIGLLVNKCGVDVNAQALIPSVPSGKDLVLGPTALHVLADSQFYWQLLAIRFLVEKGAIVDARDSAGRTPLHLACGGHRIDLMRRSHGYWGQECVKLLLDLGADPNALDNEGLSPIHKAGSSPEIIKALIRRGARLDAGKISPLFAVIQQQNARALRAILDLGADPNSIDTKSFCKLNYKINDQAKTALKTALFCASFPGNTSDASTTLVQLLLSFGADPFVPLNDHETLIHFVFENAEYSIISAYIEFAHKIDLNATDQRGRNLLHAACSWLSTDNEGRNALHHIIDNPYMEADTILQFLAHDVAKSDAFTHGFPNAASSTSQCLCTRKTRPEFSILTDDEEQTYWKAHYDGCIRLWQKYLNTGGNFNFWHGSEQRSNEGGDLLPRRALLGFVSKQFDSGYVRYE